MLRVIVLLLAFSGTVAAQNRPLLVADFEAGPLPRTTGGKVAWTDEAAVGDRAVHWTAARDGTEVRLILPLAKNDLSGWGKISFSIRTLRPISHDVLHIALEGKSSGDHYRFCMPVLGVSSGWQRFGLPVNAFRRAGATDPRKLHRLAFIFGKDRGAVDVCIDHVLLHPGGHRWWRRTVDPIDFDDAMHHPNVEVQNGAVQFVRKSEEGSGHLRWKVNRNGKASYLYLRPVPRVPRNYGRLAFRMRSTVDMDRGVGIWLGNAYGEFLYLEAQEPGRMWQDYDLPLAFFGRRRAKYAQDATIYLAFSTQLKDGVDSLFIDVDDVRWNANGSWPPLRPEKMYFTEDRDRSMVFGRPGPVRLYRQDRVSAIEWCGHTGKGAVLRLRCLPQDLRPYRAIRLRLGVDRNVPAGAFLVRFDEEPDLPYGRLGEIRFPLPALKAGWQDVEVPFDSGKRDPYATFGAVDEVSLVGTRPDRDRLDLKLSLQIVEAVPGKRSGTQWTRALQARIDALAGKGAEGIETLVKIRRTHTGPEGAEVRLSVVKALVRIGPEALDALVPLVADPDPAVQVRASLRVQDWGEKVAPAVPALLEQIGTNEDDRAHEVFHVLLIAGPKGAEAVVDFLESEETWIHRGAQHALENATTMPKTAVKRLEQRMKRAPVKIARRHVRQLLRIGKAGRAAVRRMLESGPGVRQLLAFEMLCEANRLGDPERALGFLGEVDRVEAARLLLETDTEYVLDRLEGRGRVRDVHSLRKAALTVLAAAFRGDNDAARTAALHALKKDSPFKHALIEPLAEGFKQFDPHERRLAVSFFVKAQKVSPALRKTLHAALEDKEASVRTHTARMLMENPRILVSLSAALLKALKDGDPKVRKAAATALSLHSTEALSVVEALATTLEDCDLTVALAAARSIRTLVNGTGVSAPALERFLESVRYRAWLKDEAARLLGKLGRDQSADRPRVVCEMADTLDRDAIPYLIPLVRREAIPVICAAIEQLVLLRAKEALPVLRLLTRHPKEEVRKAAGPAVIRLDPDECGSVVRTLLDDEASVVRHAVLECLSQMQVKDVAWKVLEFVRYADLQTRVAALNALSLCGDRKHALAVAEVLEEARKKHKERGDVADVRVELEALKTLGDLDPDGYSEVLLGYLRKSPEPGAEWLAIQCQKIAGFALARVQHPQARTFLIDNEEWFQLHWYTEPAVMKRLAHKRIPIEVLFRNTAVETVRLIAAAAGTTARFDVEVSNRRVYSFSEMQGEKFHREWSGLTLSALDLLRGSDLARGLANEKVSILVLEGEIRLVPTARALSYWRGQVRKWERERKR